MNTRGVIVLLVVSLMTWRVHGQAPAYQAVDLFEAYQANWTALQRYDYVCRRMLVKEDPDAQTSSFETMSRTVLDTERQAIVAAIQRETTIYPAPKSDEGALGGFDLRALSGADGLYYRRTFPKPTEPQPAFDKTLQYATSGYDIIDLSSIGILLFPSANRFSKAHQKRLALIIAQHADAKVTTRGSIATVRHTMVRENEELTATIDKVWEFDVRRYVPTKKSVYLTYNGDYTYTYKGERRRLTWADGQRRLAWEETYGWEKRGEFYLPTSIESTTRLPTGVKKLLYASFDWLVVNDEIPMLRKQPPRITDSQADAIQFLQQGQALAERLRREGGKD